VIRFAPQPQRTACPVTKKAIFENLESDQSVARLVNPNFGLAVLIVLTGIEPEELIGG
jgi:hypothetical protein